MLWSHSQHMEVFRPGTESVTATTYAAGVATRDPLTHCTGPGIQPIPLQQPAPLRWESLSLSFFFFCFGLFRAISATYGSSQARGPTERQLLAKATATAMPDQSHICDLYTTAHGNARSLIH